MMMPRERYDTMFEDYLQKISLTSTQADTIDSAVKHAVELFYSAYDGDVDIYQQGSFALGTIVKPLTSKESTSNNPGEFDVDIVLERRNWGGARTSLSEVRNILTDEFENKVDSKQRRCCERVCYTEDYNTGVSFHVDFVPILNDCVDDNQSRKAADRSSDCWFQSDTKALVEWFDKEKENHPFLAPLIIIAKRMRDLAGLTDYISSICVMGIACCNYVDSGTYAGDLLFFLKKARDVFNPNRSGVEVYIETQHDNLAVNITNSQRQRLYDYYNSAYAELKTVFESEELQKKVIEKYLGSSFPSEVDGYPECLEALRRKGISVLTNGDLKKGELHEAKIKEYRNFGIMSKYKRNENLLFTLKERVDGWQTVWWQVLNAEHSEDRRGALFQSRRKNYDNGGLVRSENPFSNFEYTKYVGKHWIRCFVVNEKGKVVQIANKFFVVVDD